jgi:RNA polymerase sigma factor (sigma-70 family)
LGLPETHADAQRKVVSYAHYSVLDAFNELVPRRERTKKNAVRPMDPVAMDNRAADDSGEIMAHERLRRSRLLRCIKRLKSHQRQVLRQLLSLKFSQAAVAQELNMSKQNVHNILERAKPHLRKCLENLIEGNE